LVPSFALLLGLAALRTPSSSNTQTPFDGLRVSGKMLLKRRRESAHAEPVEARGGAFQQPARQWSASVALGRLSHSHQVPYRLMWAALSLLVLLGLALLVIDASYFFPANPLPMYWSGVSRVNKDHDPNFAYYLLGNFKQGGWWYYFAAALLFKTPG